MSPYTSILAQRHNVPLSLRLLNTSSRLFRPHRLNNFTFLIVQHRYYNRIRTQPKLFLAFRSSYMYCIIRTFYQLKSLGSDCGHSFTETLCTFVPRLYVLVYRDFVYFSTETLCTCVPRFCVLVYRDFVYLCSETLCTCVPRPCVLVY